MSNNVRKSSLEQAKSDFEEIRRFAQQQIETKLQEEVDKKILEVINEEINISIDEEGNIEVDKDGEQIIHTNVSEEDFEEEPIEVSDDEEPIEVFDEEQINEKMLEMNKMTNEAEAAPTATPTTAPVATPAPVAEVPVAEEPVVEEPAIEEPVVEEPVAEEGQIDDLISKMDTLINVLMQQQGVSVDQQGGEQEFEIVDDEQAESTPTDASVEEMPVPPVQEEMTFEIEEFEEGTDILEIIDEEIDDNSNIETIEIVDEDEYSLEEDEVKEMYGVGHNFRHSNSFGKLPNQGVGNRNDLNESKKIKAQYESKLGELVKENKGLHTELKSLQLERKEFEDAFIQLREQFDEMQTFNGKLALVNKLLMNGGLSFDQKLTVCEQFDGADTIEEAEKIYKNIIKENNIKVNDASNKIKASTTHTAKTTTETKPLYESEEARRMKELAGMSNRLND